MTLILAFFATHFLAIGGAIVTLAVGLFAGHKVGSSGLAKAKAGEQTAQSDAAYANAKVTAVTSADDAKTSAAAIPDADLDAKGKDLGILRD